MVSNTRKRRLRKRRLSKKRLSKKRLSKRRLSKKRLSKRRLSKNSKSKNVGKMGTANLNKLKEKIKVFLTEAKLKELLVEFKKTNKKFNHIKLPKNLPSIRNYIDSLKKSDISKNMKLYYNNAGNNAGNTDTCSVCFEKISSDNKIITKCNHSFCKDCLKNWMEQPIARNKCPLCRQSALNVEQRRSLGLPTSPPRGTRTRRIRRIRNQDGSITEIRPYVSPNQSSSNNVFIFSMVFSYLYFIMDFDHYFCVVFSYFIMRYIIDIMYNN